VATAEQLSSAINGRRDIPIDVVPDHAMGGSNYGQELVNQQAPGSYKYGSGPSAYLSVAPGTKTLASKSFDEEKRARSVAEDLGERKFQEDLRAQKVAEALRASGGGGSGGSSGGTSKPPTATERLEAYRKGYVDFGIRQLGVIPYNAEAPYNAFRAVQSLMNQQLADTGLKNTDYNDILKQVALAVGYEMPDKKSGGTDEEELMKMLGITAE